MRNQKRASGRSKQVLFHAITEPLEQRRLLNGAMDPAFGTVGIAAVTLPTNYHIVSLKAQGDGKFLAVARDPTINTQSQFVIARFTAAGALDSTFGANGVDEISIGQGADAEDVWESGSQIYVVGTSVSNVTASSMTVVSLNAADGTLNTSFGTGGIVQVTLPGVANTSGSTIIVDPPNSGLSGIYAIGYNQSPHSGGGIPANLVVADLDSSGNLVTGFNSGAFTAFGDFVPHAVTATPNGDLLIVGSPSAVHSGQSSSIAAIGRGGSVGSFGSGSPVSFGAGDSPATSIFAGFFGTVYTATYGSSGDTIYRFDYSGKLQSSTVVPVTDSSATQPAGHPKVAGVEDGSIVVLSDRISFNGVAQAGIALLVSAGAQRTPSFFGEPGTESDPFPLALTLQANGNTVQAFSGSLSGAVADPIGVSGFVYNDANENFILDASEKPLSGLQLFVDVNGTGVFAANDPQATTAADGTFSFSGLPLWCTASGQPLQFYVVNDPTFAPRSFTISTAIGTVLQATLALSDGVAITGHVVEVYSAAPLAGLTVFADQNANGQLDPGEPSAVTDSSGNYRLADLPAGTYTVTVAPPANEIQVLPASGTSQNVTVGAAGTTNKTGPYFQLQPTNGIVGSEYIDSTGLGTSLSLAKSVETQVYIDLNNNGVLDAGDITGRFDSDGHVIFHNLSNGTYTIRQALDAVPYVQTVPAGNAGVQVTVDGSSLPSFSFANYALRSYYGTYTTASAVSSSYPPVGTVVTATITASDGTVTNRNLSISSLGSFSLNGVGPQSSVVFTPGALAGYSISPAFVTENSSSLTSVPINFVATATGSISGTVYQDNNGNGMQDSGDAGISNGVTLSQLNAFGGSAVWSYNIEPNASGAYTLTHLPPGYYQLQQTLPAGYVKQTAPVGGTYSFSLPPGGSLTGFNFGDLPFVPSTPLTGKPIGTAGSNQNSGNTIAKAFDGNLSTFFDGPMPSGDWVGLDLGSGFNITQLSFAPRPGYESLMNGGIFQASNVPDFSSGVTTLYTIGPAANLPAGQLTNIQLPEILGPAYRYVRYAGPANSYGDIAELQFYGLPGTHVGGKITGTVTNGSSPTVVYLDANNNGQLDVGELVTNTDATGHYIFTSVPAGSYLIRQGTNSNGFTQVTPANNAGIAVTVTDGSTFSAGNFTDRPEYYPLTGKVIGTGGSYKNNGNTAAKAFDGNLSTYFDGPTASGDWIGLDLGSPMIVVQINIASRPGYASRMNGGVFQASNSATFSSGVVNLYAIGKTANPPSGTYTEESSSTWTPYRYVRYVAPANSYGDVAEIQFIGHAPVVLTRFTGTVIGTAGSYQNKGNTAAKAFDGNLSTFFDGPTANGNWVGLDLGQLEVVQQITFAPRSGYGSRMVGGIIQASNTADFSSGVINIYTITGVPASNQLTTITLPGSSAVQARYFRYLSPANSYGDIAELAFYG